MANDPPVFFLRDSNDTYRATEWTRGPWSREHQHGGPPSALLAHAIERLVPHEFDVARVTVEFLRPVPISAVRVAARVVRDGRSVRSVDATLVCVDDGRELCRATGLAIRRAPTGIALPAIDRPALPYALPSECPEWTFPFFAEPVAYHHAMELRFARGDFGHGPAVAWMRMRGALVAGESPSPLERAMCAADSGNGVGVVLDVTRYTFVNPDLTVCLSRPLSGDWICLDSQTVPWPSGIGLAESALWDGVGLVGRAAQSLVVAERAREELGPRF